MLVVRFPITHHTVNYDRITLTSINVKRQNDIITSKANIAYERYIAIYNCELYLRFLNGKLADNKFMVSSTSRIVSQLMILKESSLGEDTSRLEISMDFFSWNKTKYHFIYEGDFIC